MIQKKLKNKLSEMFAEKRENGNKGFTLVELIVVIVILAILIGVTIGGVYGYVNKSRTNTDINNASTITSTLSTMTTTKQLSGAKFKDASLTLKWSASSPITVVAATDTTATDFTALPTGTIDTTTVTVDDSEKGEMTADSITAIYGLIGNLLTDGLPEAKTASAEFRLVMTWDANGNFQSVKCTAYDGTGTDAKALTAQE